MFKTLEGLLPKRSIETSKSILVEMFLLMLQSIPNSEFVSISLYSVPCHYSILYLRIEK